MYYYVCDSFLAYVFLVFHFRLDHSMALLDELS